MRHLSFFESSLLLVNNLHLNATQAQVRANSKSIKCILQLEGVRDQRLEVKDAALQESNAGRPGVTIAVDESKVNLAIGFILLAAGRAG